LPHATRSAPSAFRISRDITKTGNELNGHFVRSCFRGDLNVEFVERRRAKRANGHRS
jgi:hypothetical protein